MIQAKDHWYDILYCIDSLVCEGAEALAVTLSIGDVAD
jgi:hypothetical protein